MKLILLSIIGIAAMVLSIDGLYASSFFAEKQLTSATESFPQSSTTIAAGDLEEKLYVVIGVFSLKSNATKFSQYADQNGFPSQYSLNTTNNLYYVYLTSSETWTEAKKERERILASTTLFPGIWVFEYKKPITAQAQVAIAEPEQAAEAEQVQIEEPVEVIIEEPIKAEPVEKTPLPEIKEDEYYIYPNVVYAKTYKEISAKVQVVDPVRSKLMKTIEAHELSVVKDPNNGSSSIQLIADVFGYRKVQHDIPLKALASDSLSSFVFLRGDTVLIEFPMERLKTGDIATMYNVFFRNDAAVMETASQYELNSLMEMLRENPEYTIMIHGHTNGNKRGKIIELLEENPDFFHITEENKRGSGSAKKLSEERAKTIRRYLVENGISEERMGVKGWGGSKMIYDKNGLDAKKNVRVEIEILQD